MFAKKIDGTLVLHESYCMCIFGQAISIIVQAISLSYALTSNETLHLLREWMSVLNEFWRRSGNLMIDEEISRPARFPLETVISVWDKLIGQSRVLTISRIVQSWNKRNTQQPCTKKARNRKFTFRSRWNSYQRELCV